MKRISVIIPLFNRRDTILGSLASVAKQTYPPHEIILVDDGSTDGSKSVVDSWLSKTDLKEVDFKYIRQDNQGKSVALNTGFAASTGDWIGFNDSDDTWLCDKLEKQVSMLDKHTMVGASLADSKYVNHPELNQSGFEIRGFRKAFLADSVLKDSHLFLARNHNGFFMQSLLVRRDIAASIFPLNPNLRVAQDIDLIFRISLATDFCVACEALVEIDRTPSRSIGLTKEHNMKSIYRLKIKESIMSRWLEIDSDRLRETKSVIKKRLSSLRHSIAKELFSVKERSEAKEYLLKALRTQIGIKALLRFALTYISMSFGRR